MPLNFITHNGNKYPSHDAIGGASLWIRPLAQHYCHGKGYDIGYSKEAWMLPGAIGIEPSIDHTWDAMKLPTGEVDYIFSSHCLEHVQRNWYDVIDYWLSKIKVGGMLFLYLPHSSQTYWHPSSNRKHIHSFNGSEIETYLDGLGHKVYVSGCDWNHSFVVVCEKVDVKTGLSKAQMQELKAALRAENNKPRPITVQSDIPTGHYPVKDSLLYNFPKAEMVFHDNKSADFTDTENICECAICHEKFKVGFSRYSDRENKPVDGDMVTCPNCNTMFIFMGEDILYKPNIFNSKSV